VRREVHPGEVHLLGYHTSTARGPAISALSSRTRSTRDRADASLYTTRIARVGRRCDESTVALCQRQPKVDQLWKVFNLIRVRALRSVKIGGLRRVPRSAIDEYIARLLVEAT
jgi:excisionase family DNA binding protein